MTAHSLNSARRALFVVATLVLVSCQGSSSDEGAVTGQRESGEPAAPDGPAELPWHDTSAEQLMPRALDSLLTQVFVESEDLLVTCMGDAGLDYVANDPGTAGFQRVPESAYELSTEEFVDTYGWGYSTLIHEPVVYNPDDDPNTGTYDSLSAETKQLWDSTLASCSQHLEVSGTVSTSDLFQMRSEQQLGFEIYGNDPRVSAEYERWSTCMADAGFDYAAPLDVEEEIRREVTAAWGEATQSDTEVTSVADITSTPHYQEIIDKEKGIAKASLDCDFPPPILERNETLNPVLLESLDAGIAQYLANNQGS